MLRNYFKIGYRNLLKNRVSSAINIVGLSVAIACSIVVYLFLQVYLSFDAFHENGATIFLVEHVAERDGEAQKWGPTPLPLGPALEADFPQVERAVRVDRRPGTVYRGQGAFSELVSFADVGFFEMFTFPLAYGSPGALANPNAVILSREAAIRYFGTDNPVGQSLSISVDGSPAESFVVQGVAESFPANAGFDFEVLLSFDRRRALADHRPDDWAAFVGATFVQVRAPDDVAGIAAAMDRYRALHNAANADRSIDSFLFDNLHDPALDAYTVRQRLVEAPHPVFIGMMVAVALFMMALACFNYINIALGAASRRLREIGVRKAMGSTQRQLVVQFLAENVLLCALALLAGLALAQGVLVPFFNDLFVLQISLSFTESLGLWGFLGGLLTFVAVASGAYPAFYIAKFRPTAIFRGTKRLGRKKWYTHAFLTFQFVLAFLAVIIGVLMAMNGRYMASLDWGYSAEQTLVVRLTDADQFARLRDAALQHAHIDRVVGTRDHVGTTRGTVVAHTQGQKEDVFRYDVGPGYFAAAGLRIKAGRAFDTRRGSAGNTAVVINEAFARARDWKAPIGQTIRVETTTYRVVGVVSDFLHDVMANPRPAFFRRVPPSRYQYLVARFAPGTGEQARASLERIWQAQEADAAFDYFFQDQVFDQNLRSYDNLTDGVGYLAGLGLLIACMGLFGLASQNIARRMKEISIRKVLGASLPQLIARVNRRFLVLLGFAALLATVGSYVGLRALLTVVPPEFNHMPLGPVPFVIAIALVFGIAALSVATQMYRLIDADPAEVLRYE